MSEILAPAGGKEHFLTAVNHGADAVYFGLKRFSARAGAENFSWEELEYCLNYAHCFGVKVYAAMNTLIKEDELQDFFADASTLYGMGVDAFIVQDVFLGARLKEILGDVRLHLSTQGGACNVYGAKAAKSFGFDRVVAARETALEDLREMAKLIEVESFVQGALCTAFSGQCYFSAFAGGNSANRGRCKQPCRKAYSLNGAPMCYALSLKDLNTSRATFSELREAGVAAFKIEGRMRRAEYVAAAVDYARAALSCGDLRNLKSNLMRTYNRGGYTEGVSRDKAVTYTSHPGHIGEETGTVNSVKGTRIFVLSSLKPNIGDGFKILRNGRETGGAVIKKADTTKSGFYAEAFGSVAAGDKVGITTDVALNEKLKSVKREKEVSVSVKVMAGEAISATAFASDKTVTVSGGVAAAALNAPISASDIEKCFLKTDNYPFKVSVNCSTDSAFVSRGVLNALRRELYAELFDSFTEKRKVREGAEKMLNAPSEPLEENGKAVAVITSAAASGDIAVYAPSDYGNEAGFSEFLNGEAKEKYLKLPSFLSGAQTDCFKALLKGFDGIYSDNIAGIALHREWGVKLFAGTGFNVFNRIAAEGISGEAEHFAYSAELSVKEARSIGGGFYFDGGAVKLMDLIYCPYGAKCDKCPAPATGRLTDEGGRTFILRRVKTPKCVFEIYNYAALKAKSGMNRVIVNDVVADSGIDLPFTEGRSRKGVI